MIEGVRTLEPGVPHAPATEDSPQRRQPAGSNGMLLGVRLYCLIGPAACSHSHPGRPMNTSQNEIPLITMQIYQGFFSQTIVRQAFISTCCPNSSSKDSTAFLFSALELVEQLRILEPRP
jgi:hypothetical protein